MLCDASCTDIQTSVDHCGECGNACIGGQVCGEGECACPDSGELCDDACTDTQSDADHCGTCGVSCTGGQICGEGECFCPEGQALCDGQCIDILSDNDNCGACDASCGLGDGCQTGQCESGLLGSDDCRGLAQDIVISEIAAYQTVKVQLMADGQPSEAPISALVAGRDALVRFFVEPQEGWEPHELSARLHLDTGETVAVEYAAQKFAPEGPSSEGNRDSTFEFLVAGELISAPGRFSAELVECGQNNTFDAPATGDATQTASDAAGDEQAVGDLPLDQQDEEILPSRFPSEDGTSLEAFDTGTLRIHLVPVVANGRQADTSEEILALYESAFLLTYPVAKVELTVGEPLEIDDAQDWDQTLTLARNRRQQDNPDPDVYYYGLVQPTDRFGQFCNGGCVAGVGYVPNVRRPNAALRVSVGLSYGDSNSAFTMLHEIGHNHGRSHSPCVPRGGNIVGVDGNYPHEDGLIGVTGYLSSQDQLLPSDSATDLMGYCSNQWMSDYTYNGLFNTVLSLNNAQTSQTVELARMGNWRVVLVSGSRGTRWGTPAGAETAAVGEAEQATALDATGNGIESVTVYRTHIGDWGYSIDVPEPEPDWAAIAIDGAETLEF